MADQRFVVIGASAGGVEALIELIGSLPSDLAAPVGIVIHIPSDAQTLLPQILARRSRLRVALVEDGITWENGTVYVAEADHHMIIQGPLLRSVRGPRENRHRPSIDPLFRSAAMELGPNAIGVVLTGSLDDGTAGLIAIKQRGGVALVQDPNEALYPSMPRSALEHVDVDVCARIAQLGPAIVSAVNAPPRAVRRAGAPEIEKEIKSVTTEGDLADDERPGTPSVYSCPDCGGVLWQIDDGDMTRFRCRVGHAFSPEAMLNAQDDLLEEALWSALKTLEENAQLSHRLADQERRRGHAWMVARFEEKERDARTRAEVIRSVIRQSEHVLPQHEARAKA